MFRKTKTRSRQQQRNKVPDPKLSGKKTSRPRSDLHTITFRAFSHVDNNTRRCHANPGQRTLNGRKPSGPHTIVTSFLPHPITLVTKFVTVRIRVVNSRGNRFNRKLRLFVERNLDKKNMNVRILVRTNLSRQVKILF